MNLPWDKYEYSEPFLVQVNYDTARYFMWRRNTRTGQYKLKHAGNAVGVECRFEKHEAPNPLEMFPPVPK